MTANSLVIHIVDDDRSMRDALQTLFEAAGYVAKPYATGEAFLAELDGTMPRAACVILDVRLPGISGIEVNRAIAHRRLPIPVIIITGHGDIPMAVTAVRDGAFDFVEKPFEPRRLLGLVRQCEGTAWELQKAFVEAMEVRHRYEALTPREQEVMKLVIKGLPTKVVAARLGISTRTAEAHRAHVMEKMQASSVAALIRHDQLLSRAVSPENSQGE